MWPSAAIAGESLMAVGFAASLTRALTASANGDAITVWLMGIAAFAALRGLLGWLALRLAASRARQIKTALRRRALGTILNARAGSGRLVGEHAAVVVDDIEALDGYFVRYAPAKSAAASGPLIIFLAAATASPMAARRTALRGVFGVKKEGVMGWILTIGLPVGRVKSTLPTRTDPWP